MINIEIPSHHTISLEGTHLTINHEATADLDSSSAFEGPEKLLEVWFAPSPYDLPATAAKNGLKSVSAEAWKGMLDAVHCKVLSVIESDHVDAYLLSESSMFVFNHKLILKTCGTTTLLWGLPQILEIASSMAGFPHHKFSSLKGMLSAATPYRVFYSRKNFLFPDRQQGPHRSWKDEVRYLDNMFSGGSAYMVGKMNGDHWYLYLTSPNTILTPPATPDTEKSTETKVLQFPDTTFYQGSLGNDDETLEVLMTDLEPENAKQFYLENASAVAEGKYFQKAYGSCQTAANNTHGGTQGSNTNGVVTDRISDHEDALGSSNTGGLNHDEEACYPLELSTEGHALGTIVSETCGISDIYPTSRYPDARVDAYLFRPCGFSANGVIPAPEQLGATHYFTVHVTPEPQCSYASFETNVPGQKGGRETAEVIQHVVDIFKPGRFSVTLFEAKAAVSEMSELDSPRGTMADIELAGSGRTRNMKMDSIKGYRRLERIVHEFDGYDLVFRYYERNDWPGGMPRLGEV